MNPLNCLAALGLHPDFVGGIAPTTRFLSMDSKEEPHA